jgi:hypothetical protein
MMKAIALALFVSAFGLALGSATVPASAQDMASCQARAVSKDGKPLSGAAKTSAVNKCMQPVKVACAAKAVDKNGKKLAGAAMSSFMKKCETGG